MKLFLTTFVTFFIINEGSCKAHPDSEDRLRGQPEAPQDLIQVPDDSIVTTPQQNLFELTLLLDKKLGRIADSLDRLASAGDFIGDQISEISAHKKSSSSFAPLLMEGIDVVVDMLRSLREQPLKVILKKPKTVLTCPKPFILEGNLCLHFVLKGHTWRSAQKNCQTMGDKASLVMPASEEEAISFRNFIANYNITAPTGYVWLGATEDKHSRGNWYWLDRTKVVFRDVLTWKKGEPNESRYPYYEDCLDFNLDAEGLNDDNCAHELSSVCEIPPLEVEED